jgi:hypothetical protein
VKEKLKIFWYLEISEYSLKHRRNFYLAVGNTRVISVFYQPLVFCLGPFAFNVMSIYTVPVFASHVYRAALPVVTERWKSKLPYACIFHT